MLRAFATGLLALICLAQPARAGALDDVRAGNDAFRQKQYEEAIGDFGKAIASGQLSDTALAITYNNRGVTYGEVGDFGRAIADYEAALKLKPEDETTLKNLRVALTRRGAASADAGNDKAAMADYGRALQIDPESSATLLRRAQLFTQEGAFEKALADLEQAERSDPGNPDVRDQLAGVRQRLAIASPTDQQPQAGPVQPPPAAAPTTPSPPAPAPGNGAVSAGGTVPAPPSPAKAPSPQSRLLPRAPSPASPPTSPPSSVGASRTETAPAIATAPPTPPAGPVASEPTSRAHVRPPRAGNVDRPSASSGEHGTCQLLPAAPQVTEKPAPRTVPSQASAPAAAAPPRRPANRGRRPGARRAAVRSGRAAAPIASASR